MTRGIRKVEQGSKVPEARLWCMHVDDFLPESAQSYWPYEVKMYAALSHQYQQKKYQVCNSLLRVASVSNCIGGVVSSAASKKNYDLIIYMIENGELSDEQYASLFDFLLYNSAPFDFICNFLNRIDVAVLSSQYDMLCLPIRLQRFDVVDALLDRRVDASVSNTFRQTALELGIKCGLSNKQLTRLISAGAIVNRDYVFQLAVGKVVCSYPYDRSVSSALIQSMPPELCGLRQMQVLMVKMRRYKRISPALFELVQRSPVPHSVKKEFFRSLLCEHISNVPCRYDWSISGYRRALDFEDLDVIVAALKCTTVDAFDVGNDIDSRVASILIREWKGVVSQIISALNSLGFAGEEFEALYAQFSGRDAAAVEFVKIEREYLRKAMFSVRMVMVQLRDGRRLGNDQRLFAHGGGGAGGGAGSAAFPESTVAGATPPKK